MPSCQIAETLQLDSLDVEGVVRFSKTGGQSIRVKDLEETQLHVEVVATLRVVVLAEAHLEQLQALGLVKV
jgi:hypothetical protein